MKKLYIAFKLQPSVHERVASIVENYCSRRAPLEPVPLDRLHITTLFLGETSLELAIQVLQSSLYGVLQPFDVFIGEPRSFPRVLYLSVAGAWPTNGPSRLSVIRARQAQEFLRLTGRTPYPKDYVPHLTLAKAEGKGCTFEEASEQIDLCKKLIGPGPELWNEVSSMGVYEKSECLYEARFALPKEGNP